MKELVGLCEKCGNKVFCEGGFLDGVIVDRQLLCHTCNDKEECSVM